MCTRWRLGKEAIGVPLFNMDRMYEVCNTQSFSLLLMHDTIFCVIVLHLQWILYMYVNCISIPGSCCCVTHDSVPYLVNTQSVATIRCVVTRGPWQGLASLGPTGTNSLVVRRGRARARLGTATSSNRLRKWLFGCWDTCCVRSHITL